MPPLPSVSDVVSVRVGWSDSDDLNVTSQLFFRYNGGAPSPADATSLAAALYTAAKSFLPVLHVSGTLEFVEVTDLSEPSGAQGRHDEVNEGTYSGTALAGGTAVVMSYTIARRYRGGKPRNYFPFGGSASLLTRQEWTTDFLALVATAWDAFISAAIGATGGSTVLAAHVNVSYYNGSHVVISPTTGRARNVPIRRATPEVDDIVDANARGIPGSQRRRNRV